VGSYGLRADAAKGADKRATLTLPYLKPSMTT
jgi:hypothetical protein